MNVIVRRATAFVLLAGQPVIAAAQIAPGASGRSSMQRYSGEAVWRDLSTFGSCYAKNQTADAIELLSTRVGSREEVETYKRLFRKANQSCLGDVTEMRVPYQLVRGAIAEGMYEANIPVPTHLASAAPTKAEVRNLADAARCFAAADPAPARSLLANTWLGSKEESATVQAMLPDLARCAPPSATKGLQVNSPIVRARLAEALWRNSAVVSAAAEVK